MAIRKLNTGLFNTNSYDNPDRRYDSFDFVKTTSFTHNGYVSGKAKEFAVILQSGLTIDVGEGIYNIDGHYVENDSILTFNLLPEASGMERYDIVVVGLTRESSTTIDSTPLSREGYIRVIQGQSATVDNATIPFSELINVGFASSSGTKEVELAIVKIVSGAIASISDKRVCTSTPKVNTFVSKQIVDNKIDLSEYKLQTQFTVQPDATISGSGSDLINKSFEFKIENIELSSTVSSITLNINGNDVDVPFTDFYAGFQNGNKLFKIELYVDGGVLLFKHVFNTDLGLAFSIDGFGTDDLSSYNFRVVYPNVLKENKLIEGVNQTNSFLEVNYVEEGDKRLKDIGIPIKRDVIDEFYIIDNTQPYVFDGFVYKWGFEDTALAGKKLALIKFNLKGELINVNRTSLIHHDQASSSASQDRYDIQNMIDAETASGLKYTISNTAGRDKLTVRAVVLHIGSISTEELWVSNELHNFEISGASKHWSKITPFGTKKYDNGDFVTAFFGDSTATDASNTGRSNQFSYIIKRIDGEYSVQKGTINHTENLAEGLGSDELDIFGKYNLFSTNSDGVSIIGFMFPFSGDYSESRLDVWEIIKITLDRESTISSMTEIIDFSKDKTPKYNFPNFMGSTFNKKQLLGE